MTRFVLFSVLTSINIFIVGACKGICDTLQFHYGNSFYSKFNPLWWNPALSWKNKYINADEGNLLPRFPFSTTWFVTFTDAWHTFQFIENLAMVSGIIFFGVAYYAYTLKTNVWFYVIAILALLISKQMGFALFYK